LPEGYLRLWKADIRYVRNQNNKKGIDNVLGSRKQHNWMRCSGEKRQNKQDDTKERSLIGN
jgi:hypothetical protein